MIVLDTNVVVRIMAGQGHIGELARRTIDSSERRFCSTMMQWELAMLIDKKKLSFDMPIHAWIEKASSILHLAEVPVTGAIARDAGSLLGDIHGDPCDRIMIATARSLGCPLMTVDRKILAYAAAGHVQAIDARV